MEKSATVKAIETLLAIITVIGWVGFWGYYLTVGAWTEKFGYAGSPVRVALEYAYCLGAALPYGLYWMWRFAHENPAWLFPPGKYIKGAKPKVWSPYTLTSIAVFGAVFCAAALGEFIRVDLQCLSVAIASAYFGSIVAFFGLWIGQVIARLWFCPWVAGGGAGFIDIAAWTTMDAAIWAFAGWAVFTLWHGFPEWPKWKKVILIFALLEPIHTGFWLVRYFIISPLAAARASVVLDVTTYWVLSWCLTVIGIITGATAYEARLPKQQAR